MKRLREIFGVDKPLIAMCHLAALPGRPRSDLAAGIEGVVEGIIPDLRYLQQAGVDGLLFCNENDLPYQLQVGPEVVAAVASVIGQVKPELRLPFGVDVTWDATASIAVARATGASFVRGVFSGVYATDMGLMNRSLGDLAGYRAAIGASNVALFTSVTPEFGGCVGGRTVRERARDVAFLGIDAILVGGTQAGDPAQLSDLEEAKAGAPDIPVLANTGVNHDNVQAMLSVVDGVIVGTSLKRDGSTWNPVDPDRAGRMVELVKAARIRAVPAPGGT